MRPRFFYGWLVVAVATFAMFTATLTGPAGFSVFIAPMSHDLGWSRSLLVSALSAGTVVGAVLAPFAGRLIDLTGARVALAVSGLGIAVTLSIVAGATNEWVYLFAYGLARTIDMGALNLAVTTAVANWFVRMRGRALGIATAGNAFGVMLLVPLIQWMIDGPGWRMAWLTVGAGSGLVLAVLSITLLRRRPEDLNLLPDGETLRDGVTAAGVVPAATFDWTARAAMRSPIFWLLALTSCASQFAGTGLTTHQTALLVENGLSPMTVAGAIGLYGFIWTASTMTWGFLVEKVPARIVFGIVSLGVAACCAGSLLVVEPWMLLVYVAAYGIIGGARDALDATVWADYFGRQAVGAIRGLSRPLVIGSGALGGLVGGLGYDLSGNYAVTMLVLAAVSVCGTVVSLAALPSRDVARAAA
ncbi:MAG: MFS transporter [Chloroflexota bacterium]